jgi:hypothetical protein
MNRSIANKRLDDAAFRRADDIRRIARRIFIRELS